MNQLQRSLGIVEGYLLYETPPAQVTDALAVIRCHCDAAAAPIPPAPEPVAEEKPKKKKGWSKEAKERRKKALEAKLASGWRPGMKNSEIPEPEEQEPLDEPPGEPDEGNF